MTKIDRPPRPSKNDGPTAVPDLGTGPTKLRGSHGDRRPFCTAVVLDEHACPLCCTSTLAVFDQDPDPRNFASFKTRMDTVSVGGDGQPRAAGKVCERNGDRREDSSNGSEDLDVGRPRHLRMI